MKTIKSFMIEKKFVLTICLSLLLIGAVSHVIAKSDKKADETKIEKVGFLGVNIQNLSSKDKEELDVKFGVLVTDTVKDKAAEKAGIKRDDVIQYFNGEKVRYANALTDLIQETKPGTNVEIKLVREGKPLSVNATLDEKEKKTYFTMKDFKTPQFSFSSSKRGYLGINLQDLNDDLAEYFGVKANQGVLILSVAKDAPAVKAGLKAGDVIINIEGTDIKQSSDIFKLMAKHKKGDKIAITVMRHKNKTTLNAELGESTGFEKIKILRKEFGDEMHPDQDFNIFIPEINIPNIEALEIPNLDDFNSEWQEKINNRIKRKMEKTEKKLKTISELTDRKLKKIKEITTI